MIRNATLEDIDSIVAMGRKFAAASGTDRELGWDEESVRTLVATLIEGPDGILVVGERSMLGGLVFPHPFNVNTRVFQELFWWSESRDGLKLLEEAERQARDKGAVRSLMLCMDAMPGAERIYERRGYKRAEYSYAKDL